MTLLVSKPSEELEMMVASVVGKNIKTKNIGGSKRVRGRNSDNLLFEDKFNWIVLEPLINGLCLDRARC